MFLRARLGNRSGWRSIFLGHTEFENRTSIILGYNCKHSSNINQVCALYCPMKMPKSPFWRLAKKPSQLEFSAKTTCWRSTFKFPHNSTPVLEGINKIAPKTAPNFSVVRTRTQSRVPFSCIFTYFPMSARIEKKKEEKVPLIACKTMSRLKLWGKKNPLKQETKTSVN